LLVILVLTFFISPSIIIVPWRRAYLFPIRNDNREIMKRIRYLNLPPSLSLAADFAAKLIMASSEPFESPEVHAITKMSIPEEVLSFL
jgi:hypothetical protein